MEPAYKDFLSTLAQWYKEGLIDPDFATLQGAQQNAKITGSETAVTAGAIASGMGAWIESGRTRNPQFTLAGVQVPTLREGERPNMQFMNLPYEPSGSVAITTACKNPEKAAHLLDYGYSEEGHLFFNFGIEEESYTMVNGFPTFTDKILNNPDGWNLGQSMQPYCWSPGSGPFSQDGRYIIQYVPLPEQRAALETWTPSASALSYKLPSLTPTQEESNEFSRIINEINTYVNETTLKIVLGSESLNNFDSYVNTLKRMGIERALEIQNAALARYYAR
jgi:putative aldouronate transport system substrate-binding protein